METYIYEAVLIPNELGGYDAHIPEFDITTQGKDMADATYMAQDALALHLAGLLAEGMPVAKVGKFGHACPKGSVLMGIATPVEQFDPNMQFITAQEAADLLDVTRPRIYALMKEGTLHTKKEGNARLVCVADVMERFNNPQPTGRPKAVQA